MITITYFGNLKDRLQTTQETMDWQGGTSDQLLAILRKRGDEWAEALSEQNIFRVVVNEEIVFAAVEIHNGDRVALLPPVTGG